MPITQADALEMWQQCFRQGFGKEELKAGAVPMDRGKIKDIFEALDDRFESARGTIKNDMDTAAGVTLSNAAAKKLLRAWMLWKAKGE